MSIAGRKHAALTAKVASLRAELERWQELADADGGKLSRHFTQLEAITYHLGVAAEEQAETLERVRGGDSDIVEGSLPVQNAVLDIERGWEYFRGKLAQRYLDDLELYLIGADELAWACYRPLRKAAGEPAREPPLTFLNGGASPFMIARGERYTAAIADGGVRNARVDALIGALPVAVVGLPWSHLHHVPDVAVVAHETGHVVEEDLRLAGSVRALIRGAVPDCDRVPAWEAWAGEVFADVFGAVTLGPAYLAALTEFVSGPRRAVVRARPRPGEYPTPTLRVLLCAAVCRSCGPADVDRVVAEWCSIYDAPALDGWEDDARAVGAALADGALPELGKSLRSLVGFSADDWADAIEDAERLLEGGEPDASDPRVLIAAAQRAFADRPARFTSSGAGIAALETVRARSDGARRRGRTRPEEAGFDAARRDIDGAIHDLFTTTEES